MLWDYEVQFDGAISPVNPGGVASYGIIIRSKGKDIYSDSAVVGSGQEMSNNVAEYAGVVAALGFLEDKMGSVLFCGDSMMVVSQMNKLWSDGYPARAWKKRPGKLYWPWFVKARELALRRTEVVKFCWMPREENWRCDELSKAAIMHHMVGMTGQG